MRLNFRTSYQYQFHGEGMEYVEEEAPALLGLAVQNDPGLATDASRNPELLPETMGAIGIGGGIEMGVVSLTYDYLFTKKKAPLLNRHQLSLSTNIPWIKVFRGLSAQRAQKQDQRRKRKAAKKAEKEQSAE